jgi:hypothetical protein
MTDFFTTQIQQLNKNLKLDQMDFEIEFLDIHVC